LSNSTVGALTMAASMAVATFFPGLARAGRGIQITGIAAGQVGITHPGPGSTVITASNGSIINYSKFNLGTGNSVQFVEPSATSRVLNRINSPTPSFINGSFSANGVVYFVNPAGVVFGPNAVLNVGNFYAAAGNISNSNFINGVNSFTASGALVNQGQINGSSVFLAGDTVVNAGSIVASGGAVAFVANGGVYVSPSASDNIFVKVNPGAPGVAAKPSGLAGAGDLYWNNLTNSGSVKANTISLAGGAGSTKVGGTLDASTAAAGATGGTVTVTGTNVNLAGATIDASGPAGGGTVFVGGGNHGGNASVPDAQNTTVDSTSSIHADATASGNGGNVVVWSNGTTKFTGAISAAGGPQGGNGGNAEVSGATTLDFNVVPGQINLLAPHGASGTTLLDPGSVDITHGNDDGSVTTGANTAGAVTDGAINAALTGGSVTISTAHGTTGSQTLTTESDTLIDWTTAGNKLTLTGAVSIDLQGQIGDTAAAGALQLNSQSTTIDVGSVINVGGLLTLAGSTGLASGNFVTIAPTASVTAGSLHSLGATTIETTTAITTTGTQTYDGTVTLFAGAAEAFSGSNVIFNSTLTGDSNSVTITGGATFNSTFSGVTSLDVTGATTLTTQASITTSGDQTFGGVITLPSGGGAQTFTSTGGTVSIGGLSGSGNAVTITGNGAFSGSTYTSVASIHVTGTTADNATSITTTGAQNYDGNVTMGAGNAEAFTGTTITFGAGFTGDNAVTINGNASFGGAFTGATGLHITGDTAFTTASSITTTGGTQQYDGSVTVPSSGSESFTGTTVTFGGALDGNGTGGVSVTGNAVFNTISGVAGALTVNGGATFNTSFTSASVSVSGATTINCAAITTSGGQSYGATTLTHDITLTDTGSSAISFTSTVNGNNHVVVTTGGTTTFGGAVGAGTALIDVTVNGAGAVDINGGSIKTTGFQAYTGPVSIGAADTLTSTTSGAITFSSTVDGGNTLAVNTAGVATFTGAVGGGTPLTSVTTDAPGSTDINGGAVNTTGAQDFKDAVSLGSDTTFHSSGGGTINIESTLDGAVNVFFSTTSTTTLGGVVGGGTPLASLMVDAGGGTTSINTTAVTTAGNQTYENPVSVGNNTTLTSNSSGAINFVSTLNGGHTVAISTAGAATFGGAVGGGTALTSLTLSNASGTTTVAAASVNTTGLQDFKNPLTLGHNLVLTSTGGGAISLESTVDGAFTLGVSTGGAATFSGAVGGTTALTSLTSSNAGGTTTVGAASVNTTGLQDFKNPVTMGANSVFTSTGSGAITFESTLDGGFTVGVSTGGAATFTGEVGGTTPLTSLTLSNAGGTTAVNGSLVATTGLQDYKNPVSVGFNATFGSSGGGAITFESTLDGAEVVQVSTTGATTFGGAVGSGTPLTSLTSGGQTTVSGASVNTTGLQDFQGAVTLGHNVVFASTGNNAIDFESTIDGGFSLTANTTGATTFGGLVGSITPLTSVTTNAGGTTTVDGGVATTGLQDYKDAVTVTADSAFTSSGGGAISFESTLDGAFAVSVGTSGAATFTGAVGGGTPLTSLTLSNASGTTTVAGATVNTTGLQDFKNPLTLGSNLVFTSSGSGAISFESTVDGAFTLGVSTGGAATFGGAVGGTTALTSLTLSNAGGTTTVAGASVNTTGLQDFKNAVTMGANSVFTSTGSGAITFETTLDGGFTVGVSTGGAATFTGVVGGTTPLTSLTLSNAGGTTAINGGGVTTTGLQDYKNPVTVGADATFDSTGSGAITFESTLDGAFNVTTETDGATTFSATVGGGTPLTSLTAEGVTTTATGTTTVAGVSVNTTGLQDFANAVTLGHNLTFTSSGSGAISFDSTVDGAFTLSVGTAGDATFGGVVGGTTPLTSVTVSNAGGTTTVSGASINTTGLQDYKNPVTMGGASTFASSGSGAITFESTLDGAFDVTVNTSGVTTFTGAVGATTPLTSLTTNAGGSTDINGGGVTTSGDQTFNDAVVLGADSTFIANSGGDITFASALNGAFDITTESNGTTTFGGIVGFTSKPTSLTTEGFTSVSAGTVDINGGAISTAGFQTYNNGVDLGANAALDDSTGSGISFQFTVDGSGGLSVDDHGGPITFIGDVGTTTPLAYLRLPDAADTTGITGNVTTDGVATAGAGTQAQFYNNPVTLNGTTSQTFLDNAAGDIQFSAAVSTGTLANWRVEADGGSVAFLADINAVNGGNVYNTDTNIDGKVADYTATVFGQPELFANYFGGNVFLKSLTVPSSAASILPQTVVTTVDQFYNSPVTFSFATESLTSVTGLITFTPTGTVNDPNTALTINGFLGNVLNANMTLISLDVKSALGANTAITNVGTDVTITTTGAQTYETPVTFNQTTTASTLFDSTGGSITFDQAVLVNSSAISSITVKANQSVFFDRTINEANFQTTPTTLTVDGQISNTIDTVGSADLADTIGRFVVNNDPGTTYLNTDVTTFTGQSYDNTTVVLSGTTRTLTDTGAATGIVFSNTVSITDATAFTTGLVVDGQGTGGNDFHGFAGNNNSFPGIVTVKSLLAEGGPTNLGKDINTVDGQTYASNVTVTGATRNLQDTTSTIVFDPTVTITGASTGLVVDGVGGNTFGGAVSVGSLDSKTATTLANGAAESFAGTLLTFESTLTGDANALTLTGDAVFDGAVTGSSSLHVTGTTAANTTTISTTGAQNFDGAVTVDGAAAETFTSTGNAAITFGSTLSDDAQLLTVSGNAVFNGVVSGGSSLAVTGTTADDTSSISTSGAQTYTGAVATGFVGAESFTGSLVTFSSSLTGNAQAITVNGNAAFDGIVSGASSLHVIGTTADNTSSISTSGTQTYDGATTLGFAGPESFTGSTVSFGSTLTGNANAITINGNASFGGVVSGGSSLTVTGTTADNTTSITTSGAQTYVGEVTLGAGAAESFTGSLITFEATPTSLMGDGNAVTINGQAVFDGAVTNVGSLTVTGAADVNGGSMTSTGSQTYMTAVVLTANSTFTSTGGGAITFESTLDGGFAATMNTSGATTFTGAVGATTPLTSLTTDAPGTTIVSGVSVNTTGLQDYKNPVTLGGPATTFVSSGSGAISFERSLDGASATTVNTGGLTLFGGSVGNTTPLTSLTTDAPGTTSVFGGIVTTTGAQTFNDPVTLGAQNTAFTSNGGGAITFASTLDGASITTVSTTGAATFTGVVGGVTPLTRLSVTNSEGTTTVTSVSVNTGGLQDYNNPVTVTGPNTTFTSAGTTGSGDITFVTTLNGASNVVVNTPGVTTFGGAVGGTTALTSLTTDVPGSTDVNGGSVKTTGLQDFKDAVILSANTTFTSTGTGAISFEKTLDGAFAATVNTAGVTTFGGVVGGITPLTSLTTDAPGSTDVNGGAVTTTGAQTFNDAVNLGAATTTFTSSAAGAITFASTLNGASNTFVNTAGVTTFGGAVGSTVALTSLTTDAAGSTAVNGPSVTTTGLQDYKDVVTLGGPSTAFTSTGGGAITFGQTLNGASDTTVNTSGVTTFTGVVGGTNPLNSLTTDAPGSTAVNGGAVTTTGLQDYKDAVTVGTNTTFTSTGNGAITFGQTLDGTTPGTSNTTINTGGVTTFTGVVGGIVPLSSLTTDAPGSTAVNGGAVTTTGTQTFNDAVTMGAAGTTYTSTGTGAAGAITFAKTLDGASITNVNTAGTTTFGGAVGGTTALTSLTTDAPGTTAVNGGAVTTTTFQDFKDNVTLGSATSVFTSTLAANITFEKTLDGASATTINTAGVTTVGGVVGGITPLISLTTDAPGSTDVNGGAVTTTGLQDFKDNVLLGSATSVFTSTGNGAISFEKTLNGASSTTINTGGVTTFGGVVGGVTPLVSLTTDAPGSTAVNGGAVTTSDFQTYNDAVTMGAASTTFTAGGAITFNSTLDGSSITVVNSQGTATFVGAVGGTTALNTLSVTVNGNDAATAVNTGSSQIIIENNVTATNGTTLTTDGTNGLIDFMPAANANIAVNSASGAVTFNQPNAANNEFATIVFEMQGLSPSSTLKFTNPGTGTNDGLTITGQTVTFNTGEKLSVIGDVTINGTKANTTAAAPSVSLGDISALGTITVNAGTSGTTSTGAIDINRRAAVGTADPGSLGTDFVANNILFNAGSIQVTPGQTAGGRPQFALPAVSKHISNNLLMGPFGVRQYPISLSPLTVSSFFQDQGDTGLTTASIVDLNATGTSITNPATIFPLATPPVIAPNGDSPYPFDFNRLNRDLSLQPRVVTYDDLLDYLSNVPIYDDTMSGSSVTVNRLEGKAADAVLDAYDDLFYKNGGPNQAPAMKAALTTALADFKATPAGSGAFSAAAFAKFITSTPKEAEAAGDLKQLDELFDKIENLGLGGQELTTVQTSVLGPVTPDGISSTDLYQTIEAAY
jgi:filamentous hemagglutinin family protein